MKLTGYLPELEAADPLSKLVEYSQEMLARLTKQRVQVAVYSTQGSRGNFATGSQTMDTFSYVAAQSDANLATIPSAGKLTLPAGTWNIQLNAQLFTDGNFTNIKGATGRSFIDIAGVGLPPEIPAYSRTPIPIGEDQATGVTVGLRLTAPQQVEFKILQTTGGTAWYRATAKIVRTAQ